MIALRVALLLSRPSRTGAAAAALPVVAFAVVTALSLLVVAGAATFFVPTTGASAQEDGLYQLFAALATVLLLHPLATLGGAAARLSARRREDRLAALRLLGATAGLVRATTTIEAALLAAVGAVLGVGLYALGLPAVGLLSFRGHALGAGAMWPGAGPVLGVVAAVVVLAVLSGTTALRRVVLSPLGVITRTTPPPQRWVRLAVAVAVVAGWTVLWNVEATAGRSVLALVTVVVLGVGAVMAAVNLVGPVLVAATARRAARRAGSAAQLMAARAVLEDPRGTWRSVGGVAMVSFVAVVAGVGLALLAGAAPPAGTAAGSQEALDALLVADARTGVLVTLLVSFVVVAASVALTTAASVLDRRASWVALDRAGMDRATMDAARTLAVMGPLRTVTVGAVLIGAGVVLPVTGLALALRPLAVLVLVGCVALGVGVVALALRLTRPVLSAVLAAPERA